MVVGKSSGSKNISSKILPMIIPLIFSVLNSVFLSGIVINQLQDKGCMNIKINAKCCMLNYWWGRGENLKAEAESFK
jgi:hypothetical protein